MNCRLIAWFILLPICAAMVSSRLALAGEQRPVDELEPRLAATVDSLVAEMEKNPPTGDKEYRIAVAPFQDPGVARQRRLGILAAEIVTRRLRERKPAWLVVVDRIALPSLVAKDRQWILQVVKTSHMADEPSTALTEPADLLLVGTMAVTGAEVQFELKVLHTRRAAVVAAKPCRVKLTLAQKDLLRAVERPAGGGVEDAAPVNQIRVKVVAQRQVKLGEVREWQVKPGKALSGGDQFHIRFSADADANVYIFVYGSDHKAALLFPTHDWEEQFRRQFGRAAKPQDNYCRAELEYFAPGPDAENHQRFYKLDQTPGRNLLYLCAHRAEVRGIDDIRRRLEEAPSDAERLAILQKVFDYVGTFEFSQK